jgi:GntR family transcriptional regulator
MQEPRIDPTSDRPVFHQIADHLRTAITSGNYQPGQTLPSEVQLAETFGVARMTARQAVQVLKAEGLVHSEHGRGVFVRRPGPIRRMSMDRFARRHRQAGKAAFAAEAEREGRSWRAEVLYLGEVPSPPLVAAHLGIDEAQPVFVRKRRMWIEDYPMSLADSYFPLDIARGTAITQENTGPGGVYARIEEQGLQLTRYEEELKARMPTPDETRSLNLASGIPVLDLIRVAYIGDRAVEVLVSVVAADKHVFHYAFPAD